MHETTGQGRLRHCPVRKECLTFALRIREPHGIWGGLNEMERRAITG